MMDFPSAPSVVRSLPRGFEARTGRQVCLDLLPEELHQHLVEMYLAFQPRGSIQELPPLRDCECVKWVREMIRTGVNVIATAWAGEIAGHAGLFQVTNVSCEILVIVSPAYQDMGIGTELTRTGIEVARDLGFQQVWLAVGAANGRARHVYTKCGFEYASDKQGHEIDMVCDLGRMRTIHDAGKVTLGSSAVQSLPGGHEWPGMPGTKDELQTALWHHERWQRAAAASCSPR